MANRQWFENTVGPPIIAPAGWTWDYTTPPVPTADGALYMFDRIRPDPDDVEPPRPVTDWPLPPQRWTVETRDEYGHWVAEMIGWRWLDQEAGSWEGRIEAAHGRPERWTDGVNVSLPRSWVGSLLQAPRDQPPFIELLAARQAQPGW